MTLQDEVRSPHDHDGSLSGRSYSREEMAAAVRVGVARWDHGNARGPIFWAGGRHHPDEAKRMAADWALVSAAMEREWGKL